MDRTTINLLSLLVGGFGLFVVLTKFNVPELNMSFFGQNPFAIKRDVIANVMAWIFTICALMGILLRVLGEICGDCFSSRRYTTRFYLLFLGASIVGLVFIFYSLTALGKQIAKRIWLPTVVEGEREVYVQARFIVENEGWRQDQLNLKENLSDPAHYQRANFETAERNIAQIEQLLELPSGDSALASRLERLKPYFDKR